MARKQVVDGVLEDVHKTQPGGGSADTTPLTAPEYRDLSEQMNDIRGWHEEAEGMAQANEQRISDQEQRVSDHIAQSLNMLPRLRLTRNQLMTLDANNIPEYWLVNGAAGVTFEIAFTTSGGIQFSDRPAEERELLAALGISGIQHHFPGRFNVIRLKWEAGKANHWQFFQKVVCSGRVFSGCFAKLMSGVNPGGYFSGITNEWGITGFSAHSPLGYSHPHPINPADAGEILFCLPATIVGGFDKDNQRWGFFQPVGLPLSNTLEIE